MEALLCESTTILGRIIRLATGSHSTHWAGRFTSPNSDWVVHSTIGGVQPDWWISIVKKYKKVVRFRAKFLCADRALDTVGKRLAHKMYDYGSLLGSAWYLGATRIGLSPKKNPFGAKQKYVCTEFGNEWHREVNRLQPELKMKVFDGELISPGDLTIYYRSRPDLFEEVVQ